MTGWVRRRILTPVPHGTRIVYEWRKACYNCGHTVHLPRICKEDYDGQPCNCGGPVVTR